MNDLDTDFENAAERIRAAGLGAELVRQRELRQLRRDMESFYAHASLADMVALRAALQSRERAVWGRCATLVEAFLELFGNKF